MFIDPIAKQKPINMKHHFKKNLLAFQKRLCEAFLRNQEIEEDNWWHVESLVNSLPTREYVPDIVKDDL